MRAGNARGVPITVGGHLVDSFGAKVLCSRQPPAHYVYFGNTPARVFRQLSASKLRRTHRPRLVFEIRLGKPQQRREPNVFQSPGRTFACLYRNLHQIPPLHNHPKIPLASGRYRNAEFRPTAETRFAPRVRKRREGNAPWLATRLDMDSLRGRW